MRRPILAAALLLAACTPDPVLWTSIYAADQRYINRSNIAVTVFSQADPTSAPTGSVNPGGGGFIETCNADASWCKLAYGGLGARGWVNMTPFFGDAL